MNALLMNVIIYGLCNGVEISKKDFNHPLNAMEVHGIQTAANKCKKYKRCVAKVEITRYEIGGSHLGVVCK